MVPGRLAQAAYAAALTCVAMLVAVLATTAFPAAAGARSARAAILPPANPQYSLGVGKYLPGGCSGVRDFSGGCMKESLGMINAGRQSEGLGPLMLPANWQSLSVAQQLFVLTELERTARGLAADAGLSANLNQAAVTGAGAGRDPSGSGLEALWAGGEPNPIVVVADWIYEDGLFASGVAENLNCSSSRPAGCWQHRDIVLHDGGSGSCGKRCAVGAGYSPSGYSGAITAGTGSDSYAEVFAAAGGGAQTFSWAAELKQLPVCERASGDSCAWSGSPVATTSGIKTVSGVRTRPPASVRPWFATAISTRLGSGGRVALRIHVGIRLLGVAVVARAGGRHVSLRVHRLSRHWYAATGRLAAGRWTLRIRYRPARGRRRPSSQLQVAVP